MIIEVGALFFALSAVVLVLAVPVLVFWLAFRLVMGVCWLVVALLGVLGKSLKGLAIGVGLLLRHVFRFARGEVVDSLRLVGAVLTTGVMVPVVIGNVVLGRWSRANHYGRGIENELREVGMRFYRVAFMHPIRLLGLGALTEGLEERLPRVVAKAPGSDRPRGGVERFPGYRVVGALPRGGSGARLYLAEPTRAKLDELERALGHRPDPVVIKSFSLEDGSSLPQIVRESRALDAARKLGLVLDHKLEGESFYYVMTYVPGDDLADVIRDLHRRSGDLGLTDKHLKDGLAYSAELLRTLDRFHRGGLWHKDIKPSNIIISNDGSAHLVDFGLVTPLRSAMTLTTHGTEYFRDPEIVRLAMRGVKVHEVDGVKFDLYSLGAVLFSIVENSFPAHGSLSRVTKRCPEALRWIVRRAMADTKNRYSSAREMLADLAIVIEAKDPFAVKPADLVSIGGGPLPDLDLDEGSGRVPGDSTFFGRRFTAGIGRKKSKARLASFRSRSTSKSKPKTSFRRKVGAGVVAAVILFAFSGGAMVALIANTRNGHFAVPFSHGHAAVSQQVERIGDFVRDILPPELRQHRTAHASTPFPTRAPVIVSSRPVSTPLDYDVLVVDDLPASADPRHAEAVHTRLQKAQIDVHGLPTDGALSERELEWLGEARKSAGIGPKFEPSAVMRLQQFLDDDEELDAILWLSRGKRKGAPVYRVITKDTEPNNAAWQVLK